MSSEHKSSSTDERKGWDDTLFLSRCRQVAALNGWTLQEYSERAGCDPYFLSKTAAVGRRIDNVIALANVGGVTLDWLAGLQETLGPPLNSSQLARLGAVANVAVHLYAAISLQPSDVDADEIIRGVLSVIGQKKNGTMSEDPPAPAAEREKPGAAATRSRRTSPRRSSTP